MSFLILVTTIVVLPSILGVIWPIVGLYRRFSKKPWTVAVLSGTAHSVSANQKAHDLTIETPDGKQTLPVLRNLFRDGEPLPDAFPTPARVVTFGDTAAALALGNSLYYNSTALPRMLKLRSAFFFAPVASIAYAGYATAWFGLMEYEWGLKGLGLTAKFNAYGAGFLVWITLWLGIVGAYAWWYDRRRKRLAVAVESRFPGLIAAGGE